MLPAGEIASCALDHYTQHLSRGKPKPNLEWTVYAAIVAERDGAKTNSNEAWVVSCATGTKCTAHRVQGCVLHDCHAEVLARRGLLRVLWTEIAVKTSLHQESGEKAPKALLEDLPDGSGRLRLRADTRLHLYISCSPCGDASIYPLADDQVMLHTGAKVIVSQESEIDATVCGGEDRLLQGTSVAREKVQSLGKIRTKSGRSNLPASHRSTSMSCSDKIVQWSALGLQGGLLSHKIQPPIFLTSIVVGRDPRTDKASMAQQLALERAIVNRIQSICEAKEIVARLPWKVLIPSVHIVSNAFPSDKATMESKIQESKVGADNSAPQKESANVAFIGRKRKRDEGITALSPCGISLNWQCCNATLTEMVVGARGLRQGKKPKSDRDYQDLASRLSRREVSRLAMPAINGARETDDSSSLPGTYQQLKRNTANPDWLQFKATILTTGVLAGWLRNGDEADFTLEASMAAANPS